MKVDTTHVPRIKCGVLAMTTFPERSLFKMTVDDGGPEKIMRITFDIDAELLERVVKTTGTRSKKKAIEIAMKEFLRAKRRKELSDLVGNYEGFEVTLKDLKKMRKDS